MTTALLTPFALSETVKDGRRRFWKQILPVTEINYNGQKVKFDPKFHLDLATAFKRKAYDQVPIVFADSSNAHNMDPRNFAGDVIRTEYRGPGKDQGTWALIEADREGARAIKRNPRLGVSARIVQGVEKADGRFFNRAINHVLLTMNPKVTGMSPWQAVDLSEDTDIEVVDLTAQEYKEGNPMAKGSTKTRRQSRRQIDLSALSDDEFQRLLDLAATATEEVVDEDEDLEDEGLVEDEDLEEEPRPRKKKSKVKKTTVVERESEDDVDDEEDEEEDEDDTDLSEVAAFRREFRQSRADTAKANWKTRRGVYLANGVPPVLLDLAEPVLSQPDHMTLDLSDGEKPFDVHDFASKMLDQVSHIIDMGGEIGNAYDLAVDDDTKSEADALLEAWDKQYG